MTRGHRRQRTYVGIKNDEYGGMTPTGTIIKDAWVFGLLPEEETCEGWTVDRLEELYDKVNKSWEPFAHLVSKLPEDLRARHQRIYEAAINRAKELGWSVELGEDD